MDARASLLIIDDDRTLRFALRKALARLDFVVSEAEDGPEAIRKLQAHPTDLALLDLRMPGGSGLDVLKRCRNLRTRFVILTGHGTVQAAVEAMRLGAYSFLEKPLDADELAPLLRQALKDKQVEERSGPKQVTEITGHSRAIQELRSLIDRVAPTQETVAIFGETGTGKEISARRLHALSGRHDGPFVALNAACVPAELFESELFGHKRGAFTGATEDRKGLLRDAHGGTLFIDEVGELPLEAQAKLLRALETRTVRPVGHSQEISVDVRIIAASNRDLWQEVSAGRFREDLFFRFQVFPIRLPPLRERLEDIPELCGALLPQVHRGGHALSVSRAGIEALSSYDWPGNVRELLNTLRRAALFAEDGQLDAPLLKRMLAASVFGRAQSRSSNAAQPAESGTLADVERGHIRQILTANDGNVTRAALALGIDRRTLQRKLKQYGLEAKDG